MWSHLATFFIGLFVGWNILPQPKFVKGLWDKAKEKWDEL